MGLTICLINFLLLVTFIGREQKCLGAPQLISSHISPPSQLNLTQGSSSMNSSPGADADNWSPLSQFKSNSLSPGPGLSFEENDLVKEPIQIPAELERQPRMDRFYYCGPRGRNSCKSLCTAFGYPIYQCGRISCYCTW